MLKTENSQDFTVPSVKTVKFHIGEIEHRVQASDVGPTTSLNSYLRNTLHNTATKNMCFEGGCGTCVVAVEETLNGRKHVFAVNSCLVSILSCHGWKIHTNEGIGNSLIGYHNIQKLLAANNGSQCGYCSSGMVMNMYALQESGPLSKKQIENSFGGNICRCTGYRPILEAFKKLASNKDYVPDIEELQICDKERCKRDCPGCPTNPNMFSVKLNQSTWMKVYQISDILSILKTSEYNNYMLVAGNTAKGVYHETTNPDLYIDISKVVELTNFTVDNNTLTLGANITLTKAMNIFDSLSKTKGFGYLAQMKDHIDKVAHVPVRNIGTIAGNLMTKYKHNEFPSDIFLILVTFKATIQIVDIDGAEIKVSVQDFLKIDMNKKVLKSVILNSLSDSYKYMTYKIMPRAQNAHAMVNAGFLVKINNNLLEECRIVYGGINPSFIRANLTETLLNGQNLYDNSTLQKAYRSLDAEVNPTYSPPDPSPEYRKSLAISLFYKFVLNIAPSSVLSTRHATGGNIIDRPVSCATQKFETQKTKWPLSEPVPKLEALEQTSGEALYVSDFPDQHDQLYAAFVMAEAPPGAIIQTTDTSAALKMAGVVAYYDYQSIPGENNIMPAASGYTKIEELFCSGKVQYYHQPVGIVVANSHELAVEAADQVKIYYSSPTEKPLLTVQDVLNADAQDRIVTNTTVIGTPGNRVKHVIKGTWYSKQQYHFHMEVHCCQVIPNEGELDIYTTTQWMDQTQISASNILNLAMNRINVTVRRLGGAFGAKVSRNCFVSSAAALAAFKLKKPVKLWLPFENNMRMMGKRLPLYSIYEVGVDDQGVIQYMNTDLYADYGVGGNEDMDIHLYPSFENGYDYSTWNYTTYLVNTDMPANTYARAPSSTEAIGLIESIMDHIAYTIEMDPIDVKINNISTITYPEFPKYWKTMNSWGDIPQRKAACKTFNEANRWKKKGMSIVPMSWSFILTGPYNALVSIYHGDGTVVVSHGGIEIGQGINTKVAQVVAYKFGISLDKVRIKPSYNVIAPNNFCTANTLTSEAVAYGAIQACDQLIERMKPVKDTLTNPSWETLVNACYNAEVFLSASGFCATTNLQEYRIYGLCATEVEVDILTGQTLIERVDIIEDVGDSMSPLVDIGQCEGAFVMGVGYYTSEEIIYNEEGKILTDRTWTYKPPGAKDIPLNFRIKFPDRNPNPLGILKSKATGEPPLCLSVSVPLAIRNALASARTEADSKADKWVAFNGPTTCEYTFLNSLNSYEQYTL